METEFNVEVSESELAYRSKNYHDIRAIRQRELSCASCGNVISHETDQCFSHPVFGILQCRKCNDKTVEAFKSQNRRFCHICIQRKYTFRCDNKDCMHKFCESCIKRNAAQSLEKAKTDDWECLACNTKPLWKLRAACAAVMSSNSKRTKTKKVSRNRSSDREKSSDLTKISYVRRCTLNQTKKLSRRLETLCDDEDSNGTPEHTEFRPDRYQSKIKEGQGNATTNMSEKVKIGYAKLRFSVISSDDSDIETVQQRIKKRKISVKKSRREESPEVVRKNSSDVKKNSKNTKLMGDSVSMNSRKSSVSNLASSSDDSDMEELKRSKSSRHHKSKSKNEDISESKTRARDYSSNEDSEDEKKPSRNKKKHNWSTNVTKRDKFEKSRNDKSRNDKSPKASRTKVTDDEDSDRVKFKEKKGSSKNANSRLSRDSLKWQTTRRPNTQKSTRDESPEENSDHISVLRCTDIREKMSKTQRLRNDMKNRESRNDKEDAGGKSRKSSLDHQRIKDLSLPPSDSSSGKEFQNTKIVQKNYVPLRRLSELEEDHTKPSQECEDVEEDVLPKEQTFALKNTVNHFVTEMRVAVKKLLSDIDLAQSNYRMKDSMHVKDADRMVLEATKAVANLKEYVERGENKMTDYYDRWCKKTKVRNVLRSKRRSSLDKERSSSTKNSPNKSDKKSKEMDDGESILSEKTSSSQRRSDKNRTEKSAIPIVEGSVAISDCDSDIFSDKEAENAMKKSKARSKIKSDSRLNDKEKEESKKASPAENGEFIENENDESATVEKSIPAVSSSSDENDRPEAMNSSKSSVSKSRKTSRESIDPSDTDMFETTVDKIQDSEPEISEENDKNEKVEISKKSTKRASTNEESSESTLTPPSKSLHDTKNQNDLESLDIAALTDENTEIAVDTNSKEKSSDGDTSIDESLHNTNNKKSDNPPQTIDREASTEKEQSADESVENFDAAEKHSSSSETDKNDENVSNPDSSRVEKKLGEFTTKEVSPEKRPESPENETLEKRTSVEIRDSGENEKINSDDSNTEPAGINDSEEFLSAGALLSENENNEVENPLAKSPNLNDSVRRSSVDTEIDDILNKTKERLASRSRSRSSMSSDVSESENIRRRDELLASSDSVFDKTKERSTSKSRSSNVSRASTSSDVSERENLRRREELLASSDSILDTTKERSTSKSRSSNVSRASTSSDISEGENMRRRAQLLASSNSDDSDADNSTLPVQNSGAQDGNEETPPTPPESDSNSSKNNDNLCDTERNVTERHRTKRHKFHIQKNKYYINDKRLKQECVVRLKRLKKSILVRHSRALNKSRDYVESKKLKRLVALDDLEKDKKVTENSDSQNSDSSKKLKKKKKRGRKASEESEETLMDHLNKVDNGDNNSLSEESDSDGKKRDKDGKGKKDKFNLIAEADKMAKKRLLESSDSAEEVTVVPDPQDEDTDKEKKSKSKKVTNEKKKKNSEKSSGDDEKNQEKSDKGRWRKNKLLTMTISDSDSEEDKKKFDMSQEKMSAKKKNAGSSDSEQEKLPKKKRVRRRVLHSDSDVEVSPLSDSESSDDSIKKKKKKKKGSSDDDAKKEAKKKPRKRIRRGERSSDSSDSTGKRVKTRRKRIKTADSDSDSDNSQSSPGKSGRKNIRKVIRDKQVANDTKQAAKDEEERLQRIAERQKLYNQMYETRLAGETKVDKLVLDFDEETKEPLVSVDEELVKRLKPHQAQGIKFMWDACFESLERTKSTKGSGCILAHCMGLGKTFQIVSLSHTLLQHKETGIKTIMVVCPLSTVLNWVNEFKIWLENLDDGDDIEVYELTKLKKNFERKYLLQRWQETGGVMIIGYEMFRNLSSGGKKVRKNIQETFLKCLVDPGADMVVCDEGHLLKNEETALSKAMRRVKTLRRIVLTGTPLQNNLIEYHCMVQFVKPNLLGTKKEFMNRFENPITNGQFDDSTEYDVKLMKKRAHVLHKMLEGSVQRLDYSVLTPFLPPKQEYVIFVKLTEVQIKLYRHYLDNYARRHRGVGGSLFADFQALQRIWTHPMVMQMNAEKVERANEKKRMDATDSEGSLRDFIDDGSDSDSSNSSEVRSVNGSDGDAPNVPKRGTRANPVRAESPLPVIDKTEESNFAEIEWWTQYVKEDDYEDMRISSKLLILFRILKESEQMGDKVLVFSQSLYSLSLIEKFLAMIDEETQNGNEPEKLDKHTGSWSIGLDYFRLDGQSTTDNRRRWCDIFNKPSNTRARLFLISTRAGGLGINLTAANRVIIFDASWNPSHDVQSIFRIYRFGQKKPCYVYRLLAAGTMEEKIYNRQVTKLSLSCRVVDEQQIERHYSNNALAELYKLEISETEQTLNLPKDRMLAEIFLQYKHCVETYHEHDSLLENQAGEELDEEERQQAWLEYEEEKKGKRMMPQMPMMNTYQNEILMQQMNMINMSQQQNVLGNPAMMNDYQQLQHLMSKDYPGLPEAQQKLLASRAVYEMYNYVERQTMANHNPMGMMNMAGGQMGFGQTSSHPTQDMVRMYQQSLMRQQNDNVNYPINQGVMSDAFGQIRNKPVVQMAAQVPAQSSTSSSVLDDDIVEIPSSPERTPVPPSTAPGRKSQEE